MRADHRHDDLVFLHPVEPMEPPQEPIVTPSLVWLERGENVGQVGKPLLYFSVFERRFKFFPCFLYREPRLLDHNNIAPRSSGSNQVIESGAQTVKNLAADNADYHGRFLDKPELDSLFPFSRIDLGCDFVAIRGRKEIKQVIDLMDVAIGPFNL